MRDSAHNNGWQIAEVVFGIPLLSGFVVQFFSPLALMQGNLALVIRLIGIVFVLVGVGMVIVARREFRRYQQPTDPGQATDTLITTGVFAISRNPLYLASVLFCLGIALLMNALWSLLALGVSIVLCHFILIEPEEKYLTAKFGAAYQAYCTAVYRWIGRKAKTARQ